MRTRQIALSLASFLVSWGFILAGEDATVDYEKIAELQQQAAINDWRIAQLEAARGIDRPIETAEPLFSEYADKWGDPLIRVAHTQFFFRKPRRHGYTPTLREADDAKNNARAAKPGPYPPKIRTNHSAELPHGIYKVE